MKIYITQAAAEGPTALAAFDSCLLKMGIANQNLIYLSSIIPAGAKIARIKPKYSSTHFGNRLYLVMAQERVTERNKQAWAGVGWVQANDGRGLFVEHHGSSQFQVNQDIKNTLNHMMKSRSKTKWSKINTAIQGVTCQDDPVCACVAAVYQSTHWQRSSPAKD